MEWFEMWFQDKQAMIGVMYSNVQADIEAGYNPCGDCIRSQMKEIAEYQAAFDSEVERLKAVMLEYTDGEKHVERWCHMDMKKRGVID